ncbi:unnamed protein product [Cunninghamella blakesleeana]
MIDSNQIQLSIDLHPEFGWSMKDEPIFGPGSVIQGTVNIKILEEALISKIDKIRIIFHGSERLTNITTGVLIKRKQFFGSQKYIWNSKYQEDLTAMEKHSFPFIIQLPMVQFPPTMDYANYKCYYMISAYIDEKDNNENQIDRINVTALKEFNQPIIYMPFLETCLFKTPLTQLIPPKIKHSKNKDQQRQLSLDQHIKISTNALDYVPGDSIKLELMIPNYFFQANHHDECIFSSMSMELIQTVESSNQIHQSIISQQQIPLSSYSSSLPSSSSLPNKKIIKQLEFPLSSELTPSVTFTDSVSVNYSLNIQFHESKTNLLSFFTSSSVQHYKLSLPIRIGTLGYGIRPSEELQVYSIFRTIFEKKNENDARPLLPNPTFLQAVEYEESLPVYEAGPQLPTYSDSLPLVDQV